MSFVIIAGSDRPAGPVRIDGRLVRGVTLTSAAGTVDLLAYPYRLTNPTSGITGPDGPLDTQSSPGRDGGYLLGEDLDGAGQSFDPAKPVLTVKVDGGSAAATSLAVDQLRNVLRARLWGPAELTITRPTTTRTLGVRHEPASDDFAPNPGGGSVRYVTVRLVALRPFWRGEPGNAGPWGLGVAATPMLPYLPRRVGSSTIIGKANAVRVAGDQFTWPLLSAVGGFDAVTVQLIRDGRTRGYTITNPLPDGQPLVVDHDPDGQLGSRQVRGPGGVSWARYLDQDFDLFPLKPGVQDVKVVLDNAQEGASAGLTWETLYESGID